MKKRLTPLLLAIVMLTAVNVSPVRAQWRAGVTMGRAWNHYSIDKHYMTDWHYEGLWGWTLGATGQYNFNDWLAVRADVNWTQKNHRQYRTGYMAATNYDTHNSYLQLPVMASMSFGSQKVRGFLNLGAYGGYWLSSSVNGGFVNFFSNDAYAVDESVEFNDDRDQRWDVGFVGGLGVEYSFAKHWAAQVEARCYYSTLSTQKDYMQLKDPKYNTTIGLQAAIYYIF